MFFSFPNGFSAFAFFAVIPNVDALTLAAWIWKKLGALELVVEEAICGITDHTL